MPQTYRLRAGFRDASGQVKKPSLDVTFAAEGDGSARAAARNHPVDFFADASDYAWLTNEADKVVWSLKLEEA